MKKTCLLAAMIALHVGAAERSIDGLLVLPAAVSPGEALELEILDPKRTPAGGEWTVAGGRAIEEGGRLQVRLPATLKPGDRIAVSYRDARGNRTVDVPDIRGVRVLPPAEPAPPRITGCAPLGIIGDTVCVCGNYTRASWSGLAIDGKPAGRPIAASSRVVHLRLPQGIQPGSHIISGDPALGFNPSDQVIVGAIEIQGEIDRDALLRGQQTTLRLRVSGTRQELPFEIISHDPRIIRVQGGDRQTVRSSGGQANVVERSVRGLRRGDFRLTYQLQTDPCPCAGTEPRAEDPRGFISARVLAVIPLAAPQAMAATAQALAAAHGLGVVEVSALASTSDGLIVFSIADATDVLLKVAELEADPRVRFAQPDHLSETTAGELSYALKLMRADRLDPSVTGEGINVAVIDSGVDPARAAERADLTGAGASADIHGTLMAGVILDVAPGARILAFRACVPVSAQSVQARCASSSLAKAIDLAIQRRARVLNMSLGGPRDKLLPRLVDRAVEGGIVVVAAAGNGGPQGPPGFPAALDNVIAVTAVDAQEQIYSYATRGSFIDLSAPGVEIAGTIPGNQPVVFSGTSPATAYVSGVAALMLQQQPGLSPPVLQALLEGSAKDLGPPGKDPIFGSGLVDACRTATQLIGGARLCR